ncbi:MAG: SPOR domain-containing protein [Bacteroidota bacterium]|nr:SPOR domain-containing protein [Bacteroidota bacterium]
MIATYIQELLATNNRVIVPNFGAFLVRATSKNKDAKTLDKKLKDVYFSPFLKFNDELLEKHIIKKEEITKEQAAEKIKDFIDLVKKELDNENPFEIKDFGKFIIDKQGKVQFITIANEKEEESPKEGKKGTPTAAKETTKTTTKKASAAKAKKTEEEDKKEADKKKEIKKEEASKESKLKEFTPEKEEPAKPQTQKTETKTTIYKKEKKSLNKSIVWTVAIGVPIAILIIFALINIDKIEAIFSKDKDTKAKTELAQQKKATPTKKQTTQQADRQQKTTAKTKAQAGEETSDKAKAETENKSATPKKQETKTTTAVQKKYYIIAGSFKNEKYADRFLEDLKKQGYNAEKLGERNGMHAVSYNSFADKRKALAEYRFLTQEKGLKAWILYY